jgi:hypothetical protein
MSRTIKQLVIAGSASAVAVAAQAAVVDPGFTDLSGSGSWGVPAAYTFSLGGPQPLAQSVTTSSAAAIWQPPLVGTWAQIDAAPAGTAAGNYLQLQAGPVGWSTVSQTFTMAQGETISGAFALSGYSQNGTDLSRVQVLNSGSSVVYTSTLGANPTDYLGGSFWVDSVNGSSYADWKSWSFSAPTAGSYTLQFQANSGQLVNPTDFKLSGYGLFTVAPVPEPATTVAGAAAGLLTVLAVRRGRRNNRA